jgi:hypothetical protein
MNRRKIVLGTGAVLVVAAISSVGAFLFNGRNDQREIQSYQAGISQPSSRVVLPVFMDSMQFGGGLNPTR